MESPGKENLIDCIHEERQLLADLVRHLKRQRNRAKKNNRLVVADYIDRAVQNLQAERSFLKELSESGEINK